MLKVGQKRNTRYWGMRTVRKIANLKKPVKCHSKEVGDVFFSPIIAKIEWDDSPYGERYAFWFPYWITINNKEKYGQFAPMIGEKALLELLEEAISQNFFSRSFLKKLDKLVTQKLDI
jgi:hypothetical protein